MIVLFIIGCNMFAMQYVTVQIDDEDDNGFAVQHITVQIDDEDDGGFAVQCVTVRIDDEDDDGFQRWKLMIKEATNKEFESSSFCGV